MAAPATTARVEPTGIKLDEGYQVLYAFSLAPGLVIWEKSIKLPGIKGGDPIDRTTQHNTKYRTKKPRSLIEHTNGSIKCGYDPKAYTDIDAIVNREQSITAHLPDGSTYDFWGAVTDFEPGELSEGAPPEADVTLVETDWDPVNHVEAGPVLTNVAGT